MIAIWCFGGSNVPAEVPRPAVRCSPADAAASPAPSPAPLAGGCRGIAGGGRDGNAAHPRCDEINGAAPPPTLKERLPDPAVMHGSACPCRRRAVARVRGTRRGRVALLRDQRLPSILALTRQSRAGPVDIWLLAGEAEHGIVR